MSNDSINRNIYSSFFSSYDPTVKNYYFRKLLGDPHALVAGELLGGGLHFKVWKLRQGDHFIVLKVATEDFWRDFGERGVIEWVRWVKELQLKNIPMVPPMDIEVSSKDRCLVVMSLFLEGSLKQTSEEWGDIRDLKREFRKGLKEKGYVIDDALQIKTKGGVPFVYDLSDLRKLT